MPDLDHKVPFTQEVVAERVCPLCAPLVNRLDRIRLAPVLAQDDTACRALAQSVDDRKRNAGMVQLVEARRPGRPASSRTDIDRQVTEAGL